MRLNIEPQLRSEKSRGSANSWAQMDSSSLRLEECLGGGSFDREGHIQEKRFLDIRRHRRGLNSPTLSLAKALGVSAVMSTLAATEHAGVRGPRLARGVLSLAITADNDESGESGHGYYERDY